MVNAFLHYLVKYKCKQKLTIITNKKFELMLTRRTKTYSSSSSVA